MCVVRVTISSGKSATPSGNCEKQCDELLGQKGLVEEKNLDHGTGEGSHGEASVDDFLLLAHSLLFGGELGQYLSPPTNVAGDAISVMLVKRGGLYHTNEEEDLDVGSPSDRFDRTKDIRVGVRFTGPVNASLLSDDPTNGKHANTAVLDFRPTSVVEVGLDVGTTGGKQYQQYQQQQRNIGFCE